MGIGNFYRSLKEAILNFFGVHRQYLTEQQRNYILSGVSPDLLNNYNIIYSPGEIYFKVDEKGTQITKGLEASTLSDDTDASTKAELERLKKLTQNYSSMVMGYNRKLNGLSGVRIKDNPKGTSIEVIFDREKKKNLEGYLPGTGALLFLLSGVFLLTPNPTGFAFLEDISKPGVNMFGVLCFLTGISFFGVFVRMRRRGKNLA